MKANSILDTIGNTPHVRLSKLFPESEVWVKSERSNPGGSIKDRIALAMIEAAEKDGHLQPGGTIIEPTSGNTGIGLALVAAVKGYKIVLVMPESMSIERRRLMLAYGATFDLTPREKGMKGAIERAKELVEQTPGSWMPQQFENPANIAVHVATTAQEILADFRDTPIDVIITGVGTAPDPGHRRRLHSRQPAHASARRRDRGRCRGGQGHGAPIGNRRGHAGRHQLGRDARSDPPEAPRSA
jgi:cysteine synthase A